MNNNNNNNNFLLNDKSPILLFNNNNNNLFLLMTTTGMVILFTLLIYFIRPFRRLLSIPSPTNSPISSPRRAHKQKGKELYQLGSFMSSSKGSECPFGYKKENMETLEKLEMKAGVEKIVEQKDPVEKNNINKKDNNNNKDDKKVLIDGVQYGDYLNIDSLLSLQNPRSKLFPGMEHCETNEMLFIVVHQSYELWFKQILTEMNEMKSHIENINFKNNNN